MLFTTECCEGMITPGELERIGEESVLTYIMVLSLKFVLLRN
jgi:hypothetical protein